jgi:hypothetical protein
VKISQGTTAMGKSIRPALMTAAILLAGLAAAPRAAQAWEGHGYPQVTHSETFERGSSRSWSSEDGWSEGRADGRVGYDESNMARDGYRQHDDGRDGWDDRRHAEDNTVGYLPLSFFGDSGGVGPFPVDYGYSGGGYGYVVGGGSAFAGAHASASAHVSASISVIGGFRGHGGGFHHGGGGHGCGCK